MNEKSATERDSTISTTKRTNIRKEQLTHTPHIDTYSNPKNNYTHAHTLITLII